MYVVRSLLVFALLVIALIPFGTMLLLCSIFIKDDRLWWWFAVPFLRIVMWGVRVIGGVQPRVHGEEHLPPKDDMRRVILCPKHQSTWETFYFPSMTPHSLAYVFKKELLSIPIFGWCMGRL